MAKFKISLGNGIQKQSPGYEDEEDEEDDPLKEFYALQKKKEVELTDEGMNVARA